MWCQLQCFKFRVAIFIITQLQPHSHKTSADMRGIATISSYSHTFYNWLVATSFTPD
jgi:hypothetical protein